MDRAWRIVRYESSSKASKSNTAKIVEDDVIKFGRVRFRVKKLVVDVTDVRESNGNPKHGGESMNNYDNDHGSSMMIGET